LCIFSPVKNTVLFYSSVVVTPQSSNNEVLVDGGSKMNKGSLNPVMCDSNITTCFVENESVVTSDFKEKKMPNNYEVKGESIKDFLAKPYLLTSLQWTSASATNVNLYSVDIGPLLASVTQWEFKIRGFELIRGTFNFRVQLNASPFQCGNLLIHYLPNYANRISVDATYAARYNTSLVQKFQHPNIQLDCRDSIALLSVPYIAPTPYYDVKTGAHDWGRIFIDVISPFSSGAAGILNAEITVFGYWSDVELAAPIVPQSSKKERFTAMNGKSLEEREFKLGPVANGLKAVSSAASSLSSIPFLSAVMSPLSWAADVGSQIASIFGWSKPRANEHTSIIARQSTRYYGTGDGTDVSVPTTLTCQNAVKVTDDYTIRSDDEMSLKYLLSIPTYMGLVNWTTSAASGTLLATYEVRPRLMSTSATNVVGAFTYSYTYGAPLFYLSNFFGFYRGSMKLHIKGVKTIFHSGKLLITFTPLAATLSVTPNVTTSIYSFREIVDIRESSDITLNLPYMLSRPYLKQTQNIGTVNIYVLNDLRCPETVSQDIDLMVFFTAGDDFEFQVPTSSRSGSGSNIYTPQASSEEVLVDAGIAESKEQGCNTMYSELSIGEHFTSIKQLLNRNSVLQSTTAQTFPSQGVALYPWFVSGVTNTAVTGAAKSGGFIGDPFSVFAPMYNYFRGKARVGLVTSSNAKIMMSNYPFLMSDSSSTSFLSTTTTLYGGNLTYAISGSYLNGPAFTPIPSEENNIPYLQLPYYAQFPVSYVDVWQGDTTNFFTADETVPVSTALFVNQSTALGTTTTLQRSFCDDFQLTFFIGCPALLTSVA